MIINGKYKISSLAKDLNMKNKDLTDLLEQIGFKGRTHSSVIEPDEYSILMDYITKENQIVNLNGYVMGETVIDDPAVVGLYDSERDKAAQPPVKTPAVVKEAAVSAANNEGESEVKIKQEQPVIKKSADDNKGNPGTQNAQPQTAAKTDKPVNTQNAQPAIKKDKQKPVDRFANKPDIASQQKPVKKEIKPQPKAAPVKGTVTEIAIADASVETKAYTGTKARVIDTRSSDVNLSKYDEKLDTFVDTKDPIVDQVGKQKVKKQAKPTPAQGTGASQSQGQRNNRQPGRPFQPQFPNNKWQKNNKNRFKDAPKPAKVQVNAVIPEEITVSELAAMLKVTAAEVIKRLMTLGIMANVNQVVDYDTAEYIATELGANVTKAVVVTIEDKLFDESEDSEDKLIERAPVVCVMGHVDHGKTSILDRIRHTNVTAGEAGGITQAIGAYTVSIKGKDITFLDTPGHEAFTAMRARGAMATDIAILVVAADDGIMPQTIEAINHAKAAGIDIIVAINKMDKPGANPDAIMQELTAYGLIPEAWGGDVMCVPVSALTGQGIDKLLESVLLVAELKNLSANPDRRAKGLVIESRLDKGRGPVATVLVQNGTLKSGDVVIAGSSVGRVRAMTDDKGRTTKSAGPSIPVEIVGLSQVPEAGEPFAAVEDEKMARELAEQRKTKLKDDEFKANSKVSLNDLFSQISSGVKELKIIVKGDVGGSVEAVKASLIKLSNEEVKVNVIHTAVGGIIEGDVNLASASNAIIIGFNVRPDKTAIDCAERLKVEIRTYRIIYECIDEVQAALKGMLAPKYEEKLLGHAEVRQTIHVPNVGTIAGSYVKDGKIQRNALIRVVRDGVVIYEDKIDSLKRFKDDAKEVAAGYECGIGLAKFNDIKINDMLEAYEMVEIQR